MSHRKMQAALALGAVAAIGGGGAYALAGPVGHAAKTRTVNINASKTKLRFSTSHVTVHRGKITFRMANPSPLPHGIAVKGNGLDKDGKVVNKGGVSAITVTLKKGKYLFYCPFDGHKKAGMKGTITVT